MRAFSLVELSIVLVILGLLTGGILAGQSLIRAAELRAVGTELQRYHSAIYSFRDKYMALPGDITNATRFWGAQDSGDGLGTDCTNTSSSSALTCNGNGNGQIGECGSYCYERFRAFQHLANAGLIEGTYTGVTGSAGTKHSVIGTNVPASKLNNGGWTLFYFGSRDTTHADWWAADYGNAYFFGAQNATYETSAAILKPEEAWNIDTKLDDGSPTAGFIMERKGDGAAADGSTYKCTTSAVQSTATYALTLNEIACMLIIKTGF